ncbi:oxidoreductase [Sphaerisporangium flaviroseum]|uniref:Oxidoreductase n=1 Tax=Sphaerisporangium flaviroseum TaxID=509199 RepID=A0ABP7IEV4_9ACTN
MADTETAAERALMSAFRRGGQVDLRTGRPGEDDPANGRKWDVERTVRAEVIARLVLSASAPDDGRIPALRLAGARITGPLDLDHSQITCPVELEDCHFDDDVLLNRAQVHRWSLSGSRLPSLRAHYLHTYSDLDLRGIRCREVMLYGAVLGGNLEMDHARLVNIGGCSLYGTHLTVEGSLHGNWLSSEGEIRLYNAVIRDSILFFGAWLINPGGKSLSASRMSVGGALFLQGGARSRGDGAGRQDDGKRGRAFISDGTLHLHSVHVGTTLRMPGAIVHNPGGYAIDALNMSVGNDANLSNAKVRGEIRVAGGRISSTLDLRRAEISSTRTLALNLAGLEAKGLSLPSVGKGVVDLSDTHVITLEVDGKAGEVPMRLDGLKYERLVPGLPARQRLSWLKRADGGYQPYPYEQLAATYRRLGLDADARTVLLAKQRNRRASLPKYAATWGYLQDWLVGYGYRPLRAASWLAALVAVGATLFAVNPPVPLATGTGPRFNAVVYTLDLLLPVIDFGQEKAFQPSGAGQWIAYSLITAGWILATTIAAGITRALSRQ